MSPQKKKKLNILRKRLDTLDNSFLILLKKRAHIVQKVLNLKDHKIQLSVKQAQIAEEKSLVKKFGKDAKSSGATLKDIFNKALNITGKKKKK